MFPAGYKFVGEWRARILKNTQAIVPRILGKTTRAFQKIVQATIFRFNAPAGAGKKWSLFRKNGCDLKIVFSRQFWLNHLENHFTGSTVAQMSEKSQVIG